MAKKKNKSKSTKATSEKSVSSDVISTRSDGAIRSEKSLAFLKLCRLCESRDGPFLNIFEDDKVTAKKMDQLLPFPVLEQDGLPHKICFRCSAKVEELHEFVQKCKKSQENLLRVLGSNTSGIKRKMRHLWEESLSKFKMSNDDICEKIVQKAMESIRDIPTVNNVHKELCKPVKQRASLKREAKNIATQDDSEDIDNVPLKQFKLTENQTERTSGRSSRSLNTPEPSLNETSPVTNSKIRSKAPTKVSETLSMIPETSKQAQICMPTKNLLSFDFDDNNSNSSTGSKKEADKNKGKVTLDAEAKKNEKPFDIMDHVSTIKVNGVGILFQCKLCNRNFLKKEVVIAHGCAKTGIPKFDITKNVTPPPEPPKIPTVKYINTKTDADLKSSDLSKPEEAKPQLNKPKPRIGPASRVKKNISDTEPTIGMVVQPRLETPQTTPSAPTINKTNTSASTLSNIPSLNSRYKLVPGPNNTFSLVEDSNSASTREEPNSRTAKKSKTNSKLELRPTKPANTAEVIDLDDNEPVQEHKSKKPYPVNMFTSSPQMSSVSQTPQLAENTVNQRTSNVATNLVSPSPPFSTPAMKKQSYTIVQTGNPSKLLISTKALPQNTPPETPIEEPIKKRTRKSKQDASTDSQKQPFNVILEEATPPKDAGFFTFVNIDPLLEPTYGVPGDKIIQESQITTSTSVEKGKNSDGTYPCNMCNEVFTREKKLLTHIQAHYSKMDEEDKVRTGGKNTKKKGKRSM